MSVDGRSQGFGKDLKDVLVLLGELLALLDIESGDLGTVLLALQDHVVCDQDGTECSGGDPALLAGQAPVTAHDLNTVSGFALVDEVVVADHVHRARQLAGRGFLRQLLDGEGLVVPRN